jgi:hypothetical protein
MTTLIPKYDQGATGAVNRAINLKLAESISVKDFGAVGDGTTDDTTAIQNAIKYAFANNVNLLFSKDTYAIGTTLIIPQNFDSTFTGQNPLITIEGGDSIFVMLSDIPLFTSGYYNSGVLTTNYGTTLDSHYSNNIVLQNFSVKTPTGTQLTQPLLKIQDWHQGCVIQNIVSNVNQQFLWSNNNYYTNFLNLQAYIQAPAAGDRFIFFNAHNLNKISGLVATNCITAYRFDGPVTACQFTNNSVEGPTYGLVFNATVYDISIENCYIEAWTDVAIAFNSYVNNAWINNNYINFNSNATAYFIYYYPAPGTGIHITSTNMYQSMPSQANIIKVKENVYGSGIQIDFPKTAGTLPDTLANPAVYGNNITINENILMSGCLGRVNNGYNVGNYSGRFSNGYSSSNGFIWINTGNTTLSLTTRIQQNFIQLVYINIQVQFSGGPTTITGLMIGNQFFKFSSSGVVYSTDLTGATDANGYLRIDGGFYFASTVTGAVGEIRLI